MAKPNLLEPNRTAAFNLTDRQITWVKAQAEKRRVSQATIVREALEVAMDGSEQKAEAAA